MPHNHLYDLKAMHNTTASKLQNCWLQFIHISLTETSTVNSQYNICFCFFLFVCFLQSISINHREMLIFQISQFFIITESLININHLSLAASTPQFWHYILTKAGTLNVTENKGRKNYNCSVTHLKSQIDERYIIFYPYCPTYYC